MRARAVLGLGAAATVGAAALWWRKNPSACPYGQRFWVEAPHPIIDPRAPARRAAPGGRASGCWRSGPAPATTRSTSPSGSGRTGRIEIFDLQQEFLDHVAGRAAERGLENVVPTQGDATSLPYADASVDAVVLVAVLGEIPDRGAALREIRRVLKPDGRLVVGELFGDPHFTEARPASGARQPMRASPTRRTRATASPTSPA